ncbi:hypothetical protein Dimus_033996, partial [Dionaea muscipula]
VDLETKLVAVDLEAVKMFGAVDREERKNLLIERKNSLVEWKNSLQQKIDNLKDELVQARSSVDF